MLTQNKKMVPSPEELKPGNILGWSFASQSSLTCSQVLFWHKKAVNSVMQLSSGKEVGLGRGV